MYTLPYILLLRVLRVFEGVFVVFTRTHVSTVFTYEGFTFV